MDEFIYLNPYSICSELCQEIILYYEQDKDLWYDGVTGSGMNKNIKSTKDLQLNGNLKLDKKWDPIREFLFEELNINIRRYMEKLNANPEYQGYKLLSNEYTVETLQMQKYAKSEGRYIYHNDFGLTSSSTYRVITYLWYINDVNEGGETEVLGNIRIKPKAGTLLLFPASWVFPHCGRVPLSDDKYIITGWVYAKYALL